MEKINKRPRSSVKAQAQQKEFGSKRPAVPLYAVSAAALSSVLFLLPVSMMLTGSRMLTPISWIVCILSVALSLLMSRKRSTAFILAIAYIFVINFTGSPIGAAVISGTLAACGLCSALTSSVRLAYSPILAAVPILTCISAYLFTGNIASAVIPIALLLPSFAQGLSARSGGNRKLSILNFAAVLTVEIVLFVLIYIYLKNKVITIDAVKGFAENVRLTAKNFFDGLIEGSGNVPLTSDILRQTESLAAEITNVLPGLCIAFSVILGALSQKIQSAFFASFELEDLQNESGEPIRASLIASLVFIAAHVFSFTSSASNAASFTAAAALNICITLLPLFISVGFSAIASLPKRIGILAIAVWIAIPLLSSALSSSVLTVIAFAGAACTIFTSTDSWAKQHYSKGEDQ